MTAGAGGAGADVSARAAWPRSPGPGRRAVICGAGIAGLTLAWWLVRDSWRVLLVERAPAPREGGYMMDFFGPGYDVAERMGLLPDLTEIHTGIAELAYTDAIGRGRGRVSYAAFSRALRGRLFSFMRGDLERVLRRAVADRVDTRYGSTVEAVRPAGAGVAVTLTGGRVEEADLLVGADGIHSRVRRLVFGPRESHLRRLGYHTASYAFADEALHRLVGRRFLLVAEPGRQAGLYPTGDGRLAVSLVHRAAGDRPQDPRAALRARYAGLGALVDRALARCPTDSGLYYDDVAQVALDRWHDGAVALVGDACQAVSLMAGQGASLAMAGGYTLAAELRTGAPVPAALDRYQARLEPLVRRTQHSGRRTARWLVPDDRWRLAVRSAALRTLALPGAAPLLGSLLAGAARGGVPGPPDSGR